MKIFILLFILSSLPAFTQNILFNPSRHDWDMGLSPWGITAADFNHDGNKDIAVSNKDGRSVTIRTGKGDGYFNDTLDFPVGILPVSIIAADFNQDNNPDLATSNQLSDNISVLLGNGDGTFADSLNYAAGITPRYIIGYDFNNDGKTDLAVSNRDAKTISILLGNGDGTFMSAKSFSTGNDLMPRLITAGDYNSDGFPDIAFVHAYNSPDPGHPGMLGGILEGDGTGNFSLAKIFDFNVFGVFPQAPAIITSDFNNDDKDDLAVTISAGDQDNDYCIVLLNTGTFTFNELSPFLVYKKPFSLLAGNFDDDNKIDLAVTNSGSNTVSFYKGHGDGTFGEVGCYTTAQYPRCICAADFNEDGFIDFAAGDEGGNCFSLLTAKNYFDFVTAPVYEVGQPPQAFPYWGASTDLNNDGKKDLVIANWGFPNQESTISVLIGNGDNSFQPKVNYDAGIAPKFVIARDFNRDGNIDIAVNNERSNSISVFMGNGDGSLNMAENYPVGMNPLMLCAADFNEDNNIDLAAPDYNSDDIAVLYGNNDGIFSPAEYISTDDGPFALISTDINNDGHSDLCLANSEYNPDVQAYTSVYLGAGDGTFTKVNKIFIGNDQPWMLTAGHLNDDDYIDLICILTGTNSIFFMYGNGAGDFAIQNSDYIGGPRQAVIKDFNGDSYNDIAITSNYNSNIRFLLGNGHGQYQKYPISFGLEGGAWGIIADNLDNDELPELAVTTGIFGADHISVLDNVTQTTGINDEGKVIQADFQLFQNYPNPFNPETIIKYFLKNRSFVSLKVYDVLGRKVADLVNNIRDEGYHTIKFNGSNLPSGVYIYAIRTESYSRARKMLLIK